MSPGSSLTRRPQTTSTLDLEPASAPSYRHDSSLRERDPSALPGTSVLVFPRGSGESCDRRAKVDGRFPIGVSNPHPKGTKPRLYSLHSAVLLPTSGREPHAAD
jgi:hypothetical protein